MKHLSILFLVVLATAVFAERQEYSRYQSIVDRQMFGPLPDGFDPTKPPSEVQKTTAKSQKELTKEQEQVKKSVKFSMININPKGETMVGFTDQSDAKNVRNYYLKVGETRDGWTVKAADAIAATVSISKDGVDLDLELGAGTKGGAGAKAGAPAGGGTALAGNGRRLGGATGVGGLGGRGIDSLRERRLAKRQQFEATQKAAAEDQAKREAEQKEREAREAEEKAKRDEEREQQRQQLLQIQEELKKAREARQAQEAENPENQTRDSDTTNDE